MITLPVEDNKVIVNILDYLDIYGFKRAKPPPRIVPVADIFDDYRYDDYIDSDYIDF